MPPSVDTGGHLDVDSSLRLRLVVVSCVSQANQVTRTLFVTCGLGYLGFVRIDLVRTYKTEYLSDL